jgi:hypothetical protein
MITSWSVGGGLQPSGSDGMPVGVGPPPVAGRCWRHHGGERRAEDERWPRRTGRANTAWQWTRGASLRARLNATVCARHGTARARCTSSGQGFAEPKARSRARASTARWGLEEAPSPGEGRRTGTGSEGWDTRDERARAREGRHPQGVCVIKPASTRGPVWGLAGGLCRVSRDQGLRVERAARSGRPTAAEGIVGPRPATLVRHPKAAGREGRSAPQPVRRTASPQAGGRTRPRGLPTGRDRGLAHALWQGLPEEGDPTYSERSDGVHPQRRAHPAVGPAQAESREGATWGVEWDREQCLARVHHDGWMRRGRRRVPARRVVRVSCRFLQAGVRTLEGRAVLTAAGPPPGGPRAPRSGTSGGAGAPETPTRRTWRCGVDRRGNGGGRGCGV